MEYYITQNQNQEKASSKILRKFNKQNKIVLAIPHSSTLLGRLELQNPLYERIQLENWKYSDLYTDVLFSYDVPTVIAKLSRFSMDVERYWEDSKEICFKKGQGKFYTHFDDGTPYRKGPIPQNYSDCYFHYHHQLKECITTLGCNTIIDCHSFNDERYQYADFCIGFNNDATKPSEEFLNYLKNYLTCLNYSVSFNTPYVGSITVDAPQAYKSIMIEINKNLYLSNQEKSANFGKTQGGSKKTYTNCRK